jgi:probable rRNA maturation factor
MPVRLLIEQGPHPGVSRRHVTAWARAMLAALQLEDSEWSIVLTGDDQIQNLNRMYRDKDRPTDVLAFSQHEGLAMAGGRRLLGDVIVSVPTARRQAAAARKDLAAELQMLLAHGLLHLLGWDHDTDARDRRMRRETERLCREARGNAAPRASRAKEKARGESRSPARRATRSRR